MSDGKAALPPSSRSVGRGRRFVATAFAAATALTVVLPGLAVACPGGGRHYQVTREYVALGDSFSAGVGTGNYYPESGDCHRSPLSYPPLWTTGHSEVELDFRACSGATSQDVLDSQVEGLKQNTALVTLTAGGNDVGFSQILGGCLQGGDTGCQAAIDAGRQILRTQLPDRLEVLFADIEDRSPSARVIVLGYPQIFNTSGECPQSGLSVRSRVMLNQATADLNGTIRRAAQDADLTFVDVTGIFAGHGVCSADPWMNGLVSAMDDSFHPNANGYAKGYAVAVKSVLG